MFKSSTLTAFILLFGADAVNISSRSLARNDFVKKMRQSQKKHGRIARDISFDNFIEKSVHKPGLRTIKNVHQGKAGDDSKNRKLAWWQWGGNGSDAEVNGEDISEQENNNQDNAEASYGYSNNANGDDMWGYEEDKDYVVESLKDFSLKYAGCAAVTSFSETEGDGESYSFQSNNYVTFRLCPTDYCQDDSWSGCKSTYGEYLITLEDFLTTQQNYVSLEFNAYCDFCKDCVYFTEFYGGNNNNNGNQFYCKYYEDCRDYDESCDPDAGAGEQVIDSDFDYEDFFQCTEIDLSNYYGNYNAYAAEGSNANAENSNAVYAGPHCKNGSIEIGLFSDENCYNYIGNKYVNVDLSKFEYDAIYSAEELYIPQGCMSCGLTQSNEENGAKQQQQGQQSQQSWLSLYMSNYQQQGQQGQQGQDGENSYSGISLICASLYMQSAKCNSHLQNYENYENSALQLSDNEYDNQYETCSFIENVMQGKINELGWVGSVQEKVTPWTSMVDMFSNDQTERVTVGQGFMLAASIMGSAYLGMMAFNLRKEVSTGSMQEDLIPAYDKELS